MTEMSHGTMTAARSAVFTLAEIAAALRAFNDGEASAADTLAAIAAAVEADREARRARRQAA